MDKNGVCNYCNEHMPFIPYGENQLLKILKKAKKKQRLYDALIPLSGGKDSTYVLYLATQKYGLKVLTYTYDNGFMSDLAKQNIEKSVEVSRADHIWVKHDKEMLKELYRTALTQSGELCGICGVGIERSMLKISEAWRIPLILLGHSPTEINSFTSEDIYDQHRLRAILAKNKNITNQLTDRFLIYPKLNFITSYLFTLTGRFGKKVNILYYTNIPTDKEIGEILKREMQWREPELSEYTRHFDCIAEPFTNFIREKRFGHSRRLPQLSNMVRNHEITRDEATKIHQEDQQKISNSNFQSVMTALHLSEDDINDIAGIPANVFSDTKSTANLIFAKARRLMKRGAKA